MKTKLILVMLMCIAGAGFCAPETMEIRKAGAAHKEKTVQEHQKMSASLALNDIEDPAVRKALRTLRDYLNPAQAK